MTCPRPASALTSPTRTHARTVCSSPCLCPGTGVPWVHIQAAGRFLPPWAIGKVGRRVSERWEHPPVPPRPPGPAHPIPAPLQCQLPALPELKARGHGDTGTNSMSTPSLLVPSSHCHHEGASSCLSPEPGSREEQLGAAGASPACIETLGSSCPGDSSAGMVIVAAYHGRGGGGWQGLGGWQDCAMALGSGFGCCSPLPGPGSWHCPPLSVVCLSAGCCDRQRGPVFNLLSFQTSGTAGPSQ